MQIYREYFAKDGSGEADVLTHHRTITHLEGDGRAFRIVSESNQGAHRTAVVFTHDEFAMLAAEYERYKPMKVAGLHLAGRPAHLLRALGRMFTVRPQLTITSNPPEEPRE
jgi:hypothetical protein